MLCLNGTRQVVTRGLALNSRLVVSTAQRQLLDTVRRLTAKQQLPDTQSKPHGDYRMIYKFPYIVVARAACRLKIYQTGATLVAVPVVTHLANTGVVSGQVWAASASAGVLALGMLYVMGELFRRTVGHIYIDADRESIKVSHLTFWGGRRDIVIPVSDVVPITDSADNPRDVYVKLLRFSRPRDALYLWLRFGGVLHKDEFSHVFGDLDPQNQ